MATHPLAHILHDVGLAGWFGTTTAGAVALNDAAAEAGGGGAPTRVANSGWARLTPVNLGFIGAHLVGAAALLAGEMPRIARQRGVGGDAAVKFGLTVAALGATAYARVLGQRVMSAGSPPAADGTTTTASTPPDVAAAMKQLSVLQWVIPAITGTMIALSAKMSEDYRPAAQSEGLLQRLNPVA